MSKKRRSQRRKGATCAESGTSKRIYFSKDAAERAGGRALAKKGNTSASSLRAYHCPRCKGYHLTKQS